MKRNNLKKSLMVGLVGVAVSGACFAVDSFDPVASLLTMDSVSTGGVTYRNVAVTVNSYDLIRVAGGASVADSFNSANNVLLLGSVAYQGTTYSNVSIKINTYTLRSSAGTGSPGTQTVANYTEEMAGYFNALNKYRTECGIPALSQNTTLDAAAVSVGTGPTQFAIARAAGYAQANTVGAVNGDYYSNSSSNTLVGTYELNGLLGDPFAALNLMRPYTEIGLHKTLSKAGGIDQRGAQVLLGNIVARNLPGPPVTFPCANTVDVPPYRNAGGGGSLYVGVTEGDLLGGAQSNDSRKGTPIVVFANPGEKLVLTNASVTLQGGGAVPVVLNSGASNMYAYEGYVLPQQNLLPQRAYDVVIFGTVNGAAFSRSFTFRTGPETPYYLP